jgi:hypothetical protein
LFANVPLRTDHTCPSTCLTACVPTCYLLFLTAYANINYLSPNGAPDNDRKMKESSFLASQAYVESLRFYPQDDATKRTHSTTSPKSSAETLASPQSTTRGKSADWTHYSGMTSSRSRTVEHIETSVRMRLGIASSESDWRDPQLQRTWVQTDTPERQLSRRMARHDARARARQKRQR